MMFEISQEFYFDAAHYLSTQVDAIQNRVIHGHTFHVRIYLIGSRNPETGMVMDIGILRSYIANLRLLLDHKMLNDIPSLETPSLENLCEFINTFFVNNGIELSKVSIWRNGIGDCCNLLIK